MSVSNNPLNVAKRLLAKGQNDEGKRANKNAATPAIVKRQQAIKNHEIFNSPTDNCLSPCSQVLWRPKKENILPMRLKLDDSPSKGIVTQVFQDENLEEDRPARLETSIEELNSSTNEYNFK
uniref:Uncharacterized protein n=1 Tax=Tetranychus urticae TaxID=32264 RepID=T1KGZ4_TETUR